jgi:hypothetical protein
MEIGLDWALTKSAARGAHWWVFFANMSDVYFIARYHWTRCVYDSTRLYFSFASIPLSCGATQKLPVVGRTSLLVLCVVEWLWWPRVMELVSWIVPEKEFLATSMMLLVSV